MNTIKRSKKRSFAIALFLIVSISISAQSIKEKAENGNKEAQYQYANSITSTLNPKEEDYQKAVIWLRKSAEQGYAPAQSRLGYYYWAGQGLKKDFEQAVFWYRKAAEQGNEIAQYNLGVCYANGQGVEKSDNSSFIWIKKAAEQGYDAAEYKLGQYYFYAKGTTENYQLAFEWFGKAAEQNHPCAMYNLGVCYANGYGVKKSIEKALEWYKKSSDKNDANAEYALALLLLEGNGVEKDSITAADWLLHSAGGGYCEPSQLHSFYDAKKVNQKAKTKLLELSKLSDSPNQHYFLAMTGCLYDAMQDYFTAEKYYKLAINQGSYLGIIELGLMYFYIAANTPSLYSNYNLEIDEDEEWPRLESYMFEDNTPCLEYVKTKEWTEQDNVAYWLEKAINNGFGSFQYGVMPYDLYTHLLFVYVEGIGMQVNYEKAIDAVYACLTDTTYDSTIEYYEHQEATLELIGKNPHYYTKLYNTYNRLLKYVQENHNAKEIAKKIAIGGLGECYYKGYGVEKDYNKAFSYLSEAVKYDNCKSMGLLAGCYRYGRGTQESQSKDKEWSSKAEKCGYEKAKRLAEIRGK